MSGLYVHIPFCTTRCPYCAFTSVPSPPAEVMERYVDALNRDMVLLAEGQDEPWQTLYIGGGTPTALTSNLLELMISNMLNIKELSKAGEATIEANPGSLDRERLAVISASPLNRISFGIQSFSDRILRTLGRTHTAAEARSAVDGARRAGVDNISIDLMFGVPGQSLRDWEADLREAIAVAPDHLSLYGLSLEEGTAFGERGRRGTLALPPEETTVEMYRRAWDILGGGGWKRYEISNWARPGRECRHNLDCWGLVEYAGAGASAHGFRRSPSPLRYGNVESVEEYILLAAAGERPRAFTEKIDDRTLAAEGLMLGLRRADGVDTAAYAGDFGSPPGELFPEALDRGRQEGWLSEEDGRLRFSFEGVIFSNEIFQLLF